MKKEIKFSAKLDSEEFNRSVQQMQQKLKDIYSSSDVARMHSQTANRLGNAGIPGLSKPSQDAYSQATQQGRRELDQYLQKEIRSQELLNKAFEKRANTLKSLAIQQAAATKGSQEELEIKQKIAAIEEGNLKLRERYRARDQGINEGVNMRDNMGPQGFAGIRAGWQQGGMGGAWNAAKMMAANGSLVAPIGAIAGVAAMAGQTAQIGGNIYAGYKNAPISTAANYGSATQGVFGRDAQAAYSGRSAIEMAYLPEKLKAFEMARQGIQGDRVKNGIDAVTTPFSGSLGAGAKGALAGAALGSFVPVLGTGLGAIAGGAIGVGLNAASNVAGSAKTSALLGSYLPGQVGNRYSSQYEGMMAKDFADKYNTSLEGLKNQDPMKQLALENYQNNYGRNLDFQRQMGMTNGDFNGYNMGGNHMAGFRENAINAGFTDDMAMGSAQGIMAAGGSTRASKDNAVFALQSARNFDMTNSAQTMGTLSNSLGGSEQSKQAYIKMLAEGTRMGLDSSDYREESRKFMDAAATQVNKSNTSSQDDIQRIVTQMGGFLADKTNKGVQSSQDAFNMYNENNSQTSGPRGVLRASAYMKDKNLGSMSAMDRTALSNIDQSQISADHPVIQHLAEKYNIDGGAKGLVDSMLGANQSSQFLTGRGDDAVASSKDLQKQIAALGNSPEDLKKKADLQKRLDYANGEAATTALFENKGLGGNTATLRSYTAGVTALNPAADLQKQQEIADKMNEKNTGRMEDTSVQGAAEGSRVVLENFVKFKDQMAPAAEAIKAFNDRIQQLIDTSKGMSDADRAKFFQAIGGVYGVPQNQSQSGKQSK